jgi:hypothetical protein
MQGAEISREVGSGLPVRVRVSTMVSRDVLTFCSPVAHPAREVRP